MVPGRDSPPRRSLSSSTQSRTRSSSASTLMSPVTMGAIAASQAMASAASPSSQAPSDAPVSAACARRAAHRARTCSVHSSCRAESPSSRIRSAREMCAQALTGCPARSGSSPAGGQPAHRLGQRVVVPLPLGPVILFPRRGRQRVQHRRHRRGALGGQVPVHHPGAADGGGQLHLAVRELPARVLIGQVAAGPHVHLREQARQVRQPQPAGERGQQLLVTPRPGTPAAACRSTGRSAAPPIRRPARRPARPSPADAWPPAWPTRCARRRRPG